MSHRTDTIHLLRPATAVPGRERLRARTFTVLLLTALTITALAASAASSASAAPWFRITSRTIPTHIAPGGEGTIVLQAINLGNASTAGPYTLTDNLPTGLKIEEAHFSAPAASFFEENQIVPKGSHANVGPADEFGAFEYCKATAASISCSTESGLFGPVAEFELKPVIPYDFLEMRLKVKDEGAGPEAINETQFSGGGGA